ncbi:MAG: phenylalanine--tRNA ligase subunit beta [Minisyncoccales bacterium]
MVFSYNWLQSFFKKKLPSPIKLAELLTMHAFEVEKVERLDHDFILDIDILPNRAADCFSHWGVAKEIAVLTGLTFYPEKEKLTITESKDLKIKNLIKVKVKNKKFCPRYTARAIVNVTVKSSPHWLQERLRACGLNSINNVVDAANYIMLETGQPLHAFDLEKIKGREIIVRQAKKGEKIITLDGEKYNLNEKILLIADEKDPLAIAGIKGGQKAAITSKTKAIVLESANFNPAYIKQSSRTVDLKTDASWRFENGLDPNLTEIAINRAAQLIQEVAGGQIVQGLIDFYPNKILPKRIKLDLNYARQLLGIEISTKEIKDIFKNLGFGLVKKENEVVLVEVPTKRPDVALPEDLIEEIGRIYGYEKIPAQFPISVLAPPAQNWEIFWEDRIKDILKEAGFTEVQNYSFISQKDAKYFNQSRELVELENPASEEFQYLRPSLIINLLKNIEKNQQYFKEIKIFEIGKVFRKKKKSGNYLEKRMFTGAMTGNVFYQAKGVIDLLLNKMGIANFYYDNYQPSPEESKKTIWYMPRCVEIKINNEEIGFLGEISPVILEKMKINSRVVVFDFDFEKLVQLSSEEHEYRPLSKYPAAVRDLAILVPREVRVEDVLNIIETAGGILVRDVDLFDIYESEQLPEGKKNLAFHIIYQADDRTLTSAEIEQTQQKIIKALEENPEWTIRR